MFDPDEYLKNSTVVDGEEEEEDKKITGPLSSFDADAYLQEISQGVEEAAPTAAAPVETPTEIVPDTSIPENHKQYDFAFDTAAKKYNIPKELFYSFLPVENNDANPGATGPLIENPKSVHYGDRALGLFQIMPKTAESLNAKAGEERDPLDPNGNAELFAQHIREALDRYGEENFEDAIVDFFSGPAGVELYKQGRGDERNDSNLTINEYAQKVVDNFAKLRGTLPASSETQGEGAVDFSAPFNPDDYLVPGQTSEKKAGWFDGLFPMARTKDDNIAAEKNPNVLDDEMFASDRSGIGSDIMDPEISDKYKTMAEREGAASAGIKQALDIAFSVKNPMAGERMKEHPVTTTVGSVAGVVGPMLLGNVGAAKGIAGAPALASNIVASKAASEIPAMARLASAGKWGKYTHDAITRGSAAAAEWLKRGGGDQILSDDPETKKNAVINFTSSLAGSVAGGIIPETFVSKGALQLVLQPAVDALVETGVMASFGKNAWNQENIANTLSQVVMSGLFAANDLKKVGGDVNASKEKAQAETPVNTDIPAFMRKGTNLKQVDADIEAPGKPMQGWPVAEVENWMGRYPKISEDDVKAFAKSRTPDQAEADMDMMKYLAKNFSGEDKSTDITPEMFERANSALPFFLKSMDIDPKKVSEDAGKQAMDFANFITGQNVKKDINFRSEDDEVAYNSKGPLKDGELPGFLRDLGDAENVGAKAALSPEIDEPSNTGKGDSDRAEINAITAKLPEDLDPRTADEYDLRMAGLNDDEITTLKGELDALDVEEQTYLKSVEESIVKETKTVTPEDRAKSASSLLADIRKDLNVASLEPKTRTEIDDYISGNSSRISVFAKSEMDNILSKRVKTMNDDKVSYGDDYGKQQGEWDTEEVVRFIAENSQSSALKGKKRGPNTKPLDPDNAFSEQTGDLFGRSASQQEIAEFQMNRDAERARKQKRDPLKGTIFDLEEADARATVQEDLFSKNGGIDARQQKLKRYRQDAIKNKLDEISGGEMIGGQLEQASGGTATTGNKYAGSINLERTGVAAHINKLIEDVNDHYIKNANDAEKRPMTEAENQELADALGWDQGDVLKRKKGEVWNHIKGKAARDISAASAERVYSLIERNQKKLTSGTLTENDAKELLQETYLHAAVQAQIDANANQASKALRMHGFLANSSSAKNKIKSLKELMNEAGGDAHKAGYLLEKLMTVDTKNTAGFNKFIKKSIATRTVDGVFEAFVNFILSGPVTQTTNAASNAVSIGYRTLLEKPVAAAFDLAGSVIKGKGLKDRERYFGEVPKELYGMFSGIGDAAKVFSRTFMTGETSGPTKQWEGFHEPAITGKIGSVIRTPTRLLSAADEFFKTIIYRGELHTRAYRKARNLGLKGDALNKKMSEILADPDDVMREAAIKEAEYRTFTSPLGEFGNTVMRLRSKHKALGFVLPFIKTPTNVAKYALERTPVIGQIIARNKVMGKWKEGKISKGEIADEAAKSMVGSALAMMVVGLTQSGLITGGGPKDQNKREELYRTGWLPYSIKVGDKYWSYGRLEPIGSIIGIAADFGEMADMDVNDDKFMQDAAAKIAFAFGKNITSKTYLSSVSDMVDVISEPERYGDNWIQRMGSSVVPNIIGAGAKATDSQLREINSLGDAIISKVPGLSKTLYGKRDIWGNEIDAPATGFEALISPVKVTEENNDSVDKELLRVGAGVGRPGKKITFNGESVTLSPKEYDHYQQIAGKKARMMVESLLKDSYYKSLPDEEKAKEIKATVEKARSRVRYKLEEYMKRQRRL